MIRIRPAADHDEWLFWTLRNDPDATRFSNRGQVSRADHEKWWRETEEHRFVAHDGPATVGIVRIGAGGTLSIIVVPEERGKGLGTEILEKIGPVAHQLGFTRLQAYVLPENGASRTAFLRAGWTPTGFTLYTEGTHVAAREV